MNPNEEKVSIDYQGIINQLLDKAIGDFFISVMPDDKSRQAMQKMLDIHRKHGVDAMTTFKIMIDLAEVYKTGEEDN